MRNRLRSWLILAVLATAMVPTALLAGHLETVLLSWSRQAHPQEQSAVTATPGDTALEVNWSWPKGTSETRYGITYTDTIDGSVTHLPENPVDTLTMPHTISSLVNGRTYKITVRAFVNGGEIVGTTYATPLSPNAPTGVTVTPNSSGSLRVSWTAVTNADSYVVRYRQSAPENPFEWKPNAEGQAMSSRDTLSVLDNHLTHAVQVGAVFDEDTSASPPTPAMTHWSEQIEAIPFEPPSGLDVVSADRKLKVYWTNAPGELVSHVLEYRPLGGIFENIRIEDVSRRHYIEGLSNGTTYQVQVGAMLNGEILWTSPRIGTPLGKPANVQLEDITTQADNGKLTVRWTKGDGVTSHTIRYRLKSSNGAWRQAYGSTPYELEGLSVLDEYELQVGAVRAGTTRWVDGPDFQVAPAPTEITASLIAATSDAETADLTVSWDKVDDADGYKLIIREIADDPDNPEPWTSVGTEAKPVAGNADRLMFEIGDLLPNENHEVRVFALFRDADSEPPADYHRGSEVITVSAATAKSPRNLRGVSGDAEIVLKWQSPESTDTVNSYTVRWWNHESAPTNTPRTATVAPAAGTEQTYTITGLTNGTTYWIDVAAVYNGPPIETHWTPDKILVTPFNAPTGLIVEPRDGRLYVSYKHGSGTLRSTVQYRKKNTQEWITYEISPEIDLYINNLENGIDYEVRVYSVAGRQSPKIEGPVDGKPFGKPTDVILFHTDGGSMRAGPPARASLKAQCATV